MAAARHLPLPERLERLRRRARREARWATQLSTAGGVIAAPLCVIVLGISVHGYLQSRPALLGPASVVAGLAGLALLLLTVRFLLTVGTARRLFAYHYYTNLWHLRSGDAAQLYAQEDLHRLMQQELQGNFMLALSYRYSYRSIEEQLEHCACMLDALWYAARHQPAQVRQTLRLNLQTLNNQVLFRQPGPWATVLWLVLLGSGLLTFHAAVVAASAGPRFIISRGRLVAFLDEYAGTGRAVPSPLAARLAATGAALQRRSHWQQWWAAHTAPWHFSLRAPD